MRWNAQHVHHRRHSDVTGAASQEAAEYSADKRDEQDSPERNGLNAGMRKTDHWKKFDSLDFSRKGVYSRKIMSCRRVGISGAAFSRPRAQRYPTLPGAENRDSGEDHN